jgi:hypothetical protein
MKLTMGHFALAHCPDVPLSVTNTRSGMLEAAPSARQIEIVVEHIAATANALTRLRDQQCSSDHRPHPNWAVGARR